MEMCDILPTTNTLYFSENGDCFIEDNYNYLYDVDHHISKKEVGEIEIPKIRYVNKDKPLVIEYKGTTIPDMYFETNTKLLRSIADTIEHMVVVYDFYTYLYLEMKEGKRSFSSIWRIINKSIYTLKKYVSYIDILALIIVSLEPFNNTLHSVAHYFQYSPKLVNNNVTIFNEDIKHITEVFRDLVLSGEEATRYDILTATNLMKEVFEYEYNLYI